MRLPLERLLRASARKGEKETRFLDRVTIIGSVATMSRARLSCSSIGEFASCSLTLPSACTHHAYGYRVLANKHSARKMLASVTLRARKRSAPHKGRQALSLSAAARWRIIKIFTANGVDIHDGGRNVYDTDISKRCYLPLAGPRAREVFGMRLKVAAAAATTDDDVTILP